MYYCHPVFITHPQGNNALHFEQRKKAGSDAIVRIPRLIEGSLDMVVQSQEGVCYEYYDDQTQQLVSAPGLESLIKLYHSSKDVFVVDNHNHAFSCWWRSYQSAKLQRGSHLIHIDQHSDFADASLSLSDFIHQRYGHCVAVPELNIEDVDRYSNEVVTIASFIKPALECGICSGHTMILSEYALLHQKYAHFASQVSVIVDIDLDFWAPEMSIAQYHKTITKTKELIMLPQVACVTIATSPTYISHERAMSVLYDILDPM